MSTNLFEVDFQGTPAGELVSPVDGYAILSSNRQYIESVHVVYSDTFLTKATGFESIRHTIDLTSGTDSLATVEITFMGSVPYALESQLRSLALALNGAGSRLIFNDNWAENVQYVGLWTNAGDFVENMTGMYGAMIQLTVFSMAGL